MWFLSKITSSCIWVAIPVVWGILHWYACSADGRSLGVRSRDYQIFSDGQITTFSYPWCYAARELLYDTGTTFFYIPVNFAFNLPHVTSYMHHTGKKGSKKQILKKREKKVRLRKICFRGFQPGPSESVRTKSWRLYPLDHLFKRWQVEFKRGIYSFSMVIDSF